MKSFLLAISLLSATQSAFADCTQSDLTGNWTFYTTAVGGGAFSWLYCTMVYLGTGQLDLEASTCFTPVGPAEVDLKQAKLTVKSTCRVTGSYRYGTTTFTIKNAQIANGAASMSGVGTFTGGGLFTFNSIKK